MYLRLIQRECQQLLTEHQGALKEKTPAFGQIPSKTAQKRRILWAEETLEVKPEKHVRCVALQNRRGELRW